MAAKMIWIGSATGALPARTTRRQGLAALRKLRQMPPQAAFYLHWRDEQAPRHRGKPNKTPVFDSPKVPATPAIDAANGRIFRPRNADWPALPPGFARVSETVPHFG